MSDGRVGGKLPLKSALKRNTRQQQQQQHPKSKTSTPFQVPEGLRGLLNEITKEVRYLIAQMFIENVRQQQRFRRFAIQHHLIKQTSFPNFKGN